MEIANSIIEFFGINNFNQIETLPQLIEFILKLGVSVWVVIFIIRSMFIVISIPNRRFID